ncbi:MAG: fluoride efflux transporter CrcB [Neisseriaceae bacterium]|nr:MAG: fluoride efflux transporter CrcB [Neisseriaceae bacterium]
MKEISLVFIGAGFGGVCRFVLGSLIISIMGKNFPWATMSINLIGSFLMGFLFVLISNRLADLAPLLTPLILVGILGGFTTFSSFSIETLKLIQNGKLAYALTYVLISTIIGVSFAGLGFMIAQKITN